MKYNGYYEHVIEGLNIFKFEKFNFTEYTIWVKNVTQWIGNNDVDTTLIAKWRNLDLQAQKRDPFKYLPEYKQLLRLISSRYLWLAKFPTGGLPSQDEKLLDKVQKKLQSPKYNIMLYFDSAYNILQQFETYKPHDNFFLWLRNTSDFFQKIAVDSGLAAEWLSLPTITTHYDNILMGTPHFKEELVMVIKERFIWMSDTFKIKITDKLSFLNEVSDTLYNKQMATLTLDDLVSREEKIKCEVPDYILAATLRDEALNAGIPIKSYVNEKVKKYVDKKGNPINGDKILNNYYVRCQQDGRQVVHERAGIKTDR